VANMDQVRDVCSVTLGLREDNRLRARLPLQRLTIASRDTSGLVELTALIRDEVNVKEVELSNDLSLAGDFVLKPNAKLLGPRLGKEVQAVIKAAKSGDWVQEPDGSVTVGGHVLGSGDFELTLEPRAGAVASPLHHSDAVVELDVEVSPELAAEGVARDLVRAIQQARKDEGLVVTDRISLEVFIPDELLSVTDAHLSWIADQVLATSSTVRGMTQIADAEQSPESGATLHRKSIEGHSVAVSLTST
ncbi:MAG TPA: DUF5915 domain-containing protein, partial [Microthrixaceae bacterium]|nr:DUF5915 domain-containing protein [Microthrixaceae bacterium]